MNIKYYCYGLIILFLFTNSLFANQTFQQMNSGFDMVVDMDQLDLSNRNIQDTNIPIILNFLQSHPEITKINLSQNNISDEGAALLASNQTLTSINLSENHIHDQGAIALAKSHTVQDLNLNYNHVGIAGVIAFKDNISVRALSLGGNQDENHKDIITSESIAVLAENPRLEYLNLYVLFLDYKAAIALAKFSHLHALNYSGNYLNDEAALLLAKNPYLQSLDIFLKGINLNAIIELANHFTHLSFYGGDIEDAAYVALANSPTLTSLSLQSVSNQAAMILATSKHLKQLILVGDEPYINSSAAVLFAKNHILEELTIYNADMDATGFINLANSTTLKKLYISALRADLNSTALLAIANNRSFTEVRFDGADITITPEVAKAFADNSILTTLQLSKNKITINQPLLTMSNLAKSKSLIVLGIGNAHLTGSDIKPLIENKTLMHLDLRQNQLGDDGALLFTNSKLDTLNLSCNKLTFLGKAILEQNKDIKHLILDQC